MKREKILTALIVTVFGVILVGCESTEPEPTGPNIRIEEAWVRPDPLWENAAGYFLIFNDGDEAETLISVRVEFANMSSLHETVMEGDISKMMPVENLEIPAGGQVEFKTMSKHVMIMGLDEGLEYGQMVRIVLIFEKSGEVEVEAELRAEK